MNAATFKVAERECATIARREAKNFYWGFLALPRDKRVAIYALYDFARQVDDEVDDEGGGAHDGLERQRERLAACLRGERPDAVTKILGWAVERYAIPGSELEELIDGVDMDLLNRRYASWEELSLYCQRVAGAVGRMCVRIFGFSNPAAIDHANQLGLALQLTNILRDVAEDAGMGRIYLPRDELARFGVDEEALLRLEPGRGWEALLDHQVRRARDLYREGLRTCELIPSSSAACVRTMAGIYRRILDEIERDPRRPLRERVSLSAPEKVGVAVRAWLGRA
ncbi:MAG TPA: presqualene diphosphate synthase HpnD [Candidatus Binatia bacterium]|jgi:phytoene synthase|nr:presqualene diphosphate synthase HpnD [Candidatus Binatia bacterium]